MNTAESLLEDKYGSTSHPEQANQGKNSVNATKLDSVIFLLSLLLSVSLSTTVLLWVDLEDMGGGGLSMDAGKQFNWHPVMMVLSFDLMTLAILSFKLPLLQSMDRRIRKSAHGLSWLAAIGCTIFGLVAVFQSHNKTGKGTFIPNLYSLHSWVGIGTFSLFLAQFVAGSLLYGFQLGEDSTRKVRKRLKRSMINSSATKEGAQLNPIQSYKRPNINPPSYFCRNRN